METGIGSRVWSRAGCFVLALGIACAASVPGRAWAQATPAVPGQWEVNVAPLYLWASSMDGSMALPSRTVPIHMDFGTAVENLSGIFTFAGDARRGRLGVFGDIGFVRLGTDATFEVPTPAGTVPVDGRLELDNMIVEAGGTFLVAPTFTVLGGVRTYTFSPVVTLATTAGAIQPLDDSKTNVDGIVGFAYKPRLSAKWSLYTKADVGAGESTFTWSTVVGVEYRVKPFAGVLLGYKAFGIDAGDTLVTAPSRPVDTHYKLTQYGPVFAGTLHWGK